ncbi:MAG: tail fiber domain-containing protein [Pyrinomonadaceae bacterium]
MKNINANRRLVAIFARQVMLAILSILFLSSAINAQTTLFTFQGKLPNEVTPVNDTLEMEFKLFDAAMGGTQIGTTNLVQVVEVKNRAFTVQLDFGGVAFSGTDRYIEISYRRNSNQPFDVVSPRQPVLSVPYAIRSLTAITADNALNLNGISANNYVQTNDSRLSDARDPLPGSGNYIQNTVATQASVNFNVGGTGTANILNATTQFNLGGNRILSNVGTYNLFAGVRAGAGNTTGSANSFFGAATGEKNTTGHSNAFFGTLAGNNNTTGLGNSFFGVNAGVGNTTGEGNSAFGAGAGSVNSIGTNNSFFGTSSGSRNTIGNENVFVGDAAGGRNTTGSRNSFFGRRAGGVVGLEEATGNENSFFGWNAGSGNTTGSKNTIIGSLADVGASNLSYATAIGAGAIVNSSNTIVLGRSADTVQIPGSLNIAGTFGANILNAATQYNLGGSRILSNAGTDNLFAGIGAGLDNTTGASNSFFGQNAGTNNTSGGGNSFFGNGAGISNTKSNNNSFFGSSAGLANTAGAGNSFFGTLAGYQNTTGGNNTFFGFAAGYLNTTGFNNIFIGHNTGNLNTSTQVNNSIAIGENVTVSTSNTIVIGTDAQTMRIPGAVRMQTGTSPTNYGIAATFSGAVSGFIAQNLVFREIGSSILPSSSPLCFRAGVAVGGGDGGYGITSCTSSFSSASYKTDMQPFSGGLDVIKRLKPVTFKWKAGGKEDIGLVAEEVAEVAPQLATRNNKGEVEDVKENSLNILFINAFKEQQAQIKTQQEQLRQQQQQIDALKKLVCQTNAQARVCKEH